MNINSSPQKYMDSDNKIQKSKTGILRLVGWLLYFRLWYFVAVDKISDDSQQNLHKQTE